MRKIIFLILFATSFIYGQTKFPIRVGGAEQAVYYVDSSAHYKIMILRDTLIIQKIIKFDTYSEFRSGNISDRVELNLNGDSVRVNMYGVNSSSKIIACWDDTGFLGEIGIRNKNSTGFSIFSNTDEMKNLYVVYFVIFTPSP